MAKAPAKIDKNTLPANTSDFEEHAGAGLDNVGADDLLVPRLGILQALSPQLRKTKVEFIPDAEEGSIADLGLGEIFPEGLWFLPVHYRKDYLEWTPRDTGKGLANIHSSSDILDECERDEKKRYVLPSGNYIVETAQFYGLNLSAGGRLSFIPMSSTQLKKARQLNTLASGEKLARADGSEFTAPMFYRSYRLGSAAESNNEGDWHGWTIRRGKTLPEISPEEDGYAWRDLKATAVSFRESLLAGEAKADLASMESTGTDRAEGAM